MLTSGEHAAVRTKPMWRNWVFIVFSKGGTKKYLLGICLT
ncbi:MAG: hypothetical protein Ct9H90mP27_2030 [Gammaproteobacteria bacterium]|nr:MAG: hypothetical protein Ct9H90mP27_2030 [Gammaproteobacteria bacterium]